MVIAHESRHWIFLKAYTKQKVNMGYSKGDITLGSAAQVNQLSKQEYRNMMWAGIFMGFLILILAWDYWLSDFGAILLFLWYCFGIKHDFVQILKTFKK